MNNQTDANVNIDNLASDIQNFLNSMQNSFQENREKDARINMELEEDNQDAKDINFEESYDSAEELDTTSVNNNIDTSNISEDDSNFEESDLDNMF